MHKRTSARLSVSLLFLFLRLIPALSQTVITVDAGKVLSQVRNKPIGINMDYLMDDDGAGSEARLTEPKTTAALKQMGVKFLRFPGGEKADNYLWSVAPWTKADPHFARTGSCEWPSGESRFSTDNYSRPAPSTLDFDEFMQICRTVNGEPLIVVAYDAMYKTIAPGCTGTVTTRQELLENAVQWVRYANIVKGYHIKYWMIGNESYNDSYNGKATAAQYKDDVIEFSRKMKAVDPTIKIIANGDNEAWWSTVLPAAGSDIDFLGVSNYPVQQFQGGYEFYRTHEVPLTDAVNTAYKAIQQYASVVRRDKIKVITTEFNAIDWGKDWANVNDLGHALATFEILGAHVVDPHLEAALMWNTRWVNNATSTNDLYDAIDKDGHLEPNALAMSLLGNNLLDEMVSIGNTVGVRSFASYQAGTDQLNVFLINKELTDQSIQLDLQHYIKEGTVEVTRFGGTNPSDLSPHLEKQVQVAFTDAMKRVELPPVSITLLRFSRSTPAGMHAMASSSLHMQVFPNPTTDNVKVRFVNPGKQMVKVSVYATNGNLVFTKNTYAEEEVQINTAGWPRGMYLMRSQYGEQQETQKLLLY